MREARMRALDVNGGPLDEVIVMQRPAGYRLAMEAILRDSR
jgi:hypothetical protein